MESPDGRYVYDNLFFPQCSVPDHFDCFGPLLDATSDGVSFFDVNVFENSGLNTQSDLIDA